MRKRPILFSAPMVRAILAGTKTQTRRTLKFPGLGWVDCCCGGTAARWVREGDRWHCGACGGGARLTQTDVEYVRCPYGQPDDRLWVRETFWAWGRWETRFSESKGRDEWHFVDMTLDCGRAYLFATPDDWQKQRRSTVTPGWWKRPAIHMPQAASRITLEITAIRVERLQSISEADALAEGIVQLSDKGFGLPAGEHYHSADPRQSYLSLWEAINGPYSVEADPWVWVVRFQRSEFR